MPFSRLLGALGKPNARALEAPIRAIVHEVLREQGYASPAEVQALRDDAREVRARVVAAEARVGELAAAVEAARSRAPAPAPADPRVAELEAQLAGLRDEVQALRAQLAAQPAVIPPAAPVVDAPAPLTAAPRGNCRVEGCEQLVRSKGFCSAHYQQWRRGTLKGFVGPDGTVEVGGRVVSIGDEHAAGALDVESGRVLVDGRVIMDLGVA